MNTWSSLELRLCSCCLGFSSTEKGKEIGQLNPVNNFSFCFVCFFVCTEPCQQLFLVFGWDESRGPKITYPVIRGSITAQRALYCNVLGLSDRILTNSGCIYFALIDLSPAMLIQNSRLLVPLISANWTTFPMQINLVEWFKSNILWRLTKEQGIQLLWKSVLDPFQSAFRVLSSREGQRSTSSASDPQEKVAGC